MEFDPFVRESEPSASRPYPNIALSGTSQIHSDLSCNEQNGPATLPNARTGKRIPQVHERGLMAALLPVRKSPRIVKIEPGDGRRL